jgi:hypothetical protein
MNERILATRRRVDPSGPVLDCSVYFKDEPPEIEAIAQWAQQKGCDAVLRPTNTFSGVSCEIVLGLLTEHEIADFRRRFSPTFDSAIPVL